MARRPAARGKADRNQPEIVEALERAGASVVDLTDLGKGVPDLLVGREGHTVLMEVKGEKAKLRPSQEAFLREWRGAPVTVVRSVDEALCAVGIYAKR